MKNFQKIFAEYDSMKDNANKLYSYQDFADLLHYAESDQRSVALSGGSFVINVHPYTLINLAFKAGYVAAVRKEKAKAKKGDK